MTASQRELADRLFAEAVAVPLAQQAAYLSENCADADVRREVESLLAFASRPPGIAKAIEQTAGSLAAPDFAGLRVGPYRLTNRIGQGGMGAVYRAARADDQFQKTVAIKMLRFPDGDAPTLERFRHERQILAALEDPHIARLLDGGSWIPPGAIEPQPYIVMEYVEGTPLTTYCEQEKLTIRQRLQLFRSVCDALSHAHRQLVVHRDVKPGNILVTADGEPKLLDFGISKLLNPETATGTTTVTAGLQAMTPDYASPEQARGEAVSTLTDVYSLGAVLYELLTGRRPHTLATHDPLEIAREICERPVPPPQINAELDLIILKAMQTDAPRRYQSVEQFSEDIRCYLSGLPILSRPDTLVYRASKFARRHWLGLAAAIAVFVALAGGIGVSTWEAKRADTEAATAKAVNEFLQNDVLAQAGASAQSGPSTKPDPDLKVRTALDRAAAQIEGKFAGRPAVEAAIRRTIGNTYSDLGLLGEAQKQLARAYELSRKAGGDETPEALGALNDLAVVYWAQGKYDAAEPLWHKLLDTQRRVLGVQDADTLSTMNNVGMVDDTLGKYAEAESLYTQALAIQRRKLGNEHSDTLTSINNLGLFYGKRGNYAAAEPLLTEALERNRRILGEEHPRVLTGMSNLARLYGEEGKFDMAVGLLEKVLEVRRRVLGEEHPSTLIAMNNLGIMYGNQGKYEQAEALLSKVLNVRLRVLGEKHLSTLISMNSLGVILRDEGEYQRAEALHVKALGIERQMLGENNAETLTTAYNLGVLYLSENKYAEAESLLAKVVEAQRRVLAPTDIATAKSLASLGDVRLREQKYREAETPLREASRTYEKLDAGWRVHDSQSLLGESLSGQEKYAEAEPLILAGYRGLAERQDTIPAESRFALEKAGARILRLYDAWHKPEQGAEWRRILPAQICSLYPYEVKRVIWWRRRELNAPITVSPGLSGC
jgi:serine/threonine protein kinase/Tfp pilus assembly protein PilF